MEKYESLGIVGEGSYGIVIKCRHKDSGQIVAIKKFMEGEEDAQVKKIAMREVRMLKRLRHENLVNLLEVFRRKRRLCLVFEFVENTVLDLLEAREEGGLDPVPVRGYIFQVLRGLEFCHAQNIIHRDIKPENVLISQLGVVKLCDFGFARPLAMPGENCTDYVATRWYRAPELLVGDTRYGREVDVWATGCLFAEMMTGDPLFPGDSDIDQLFHIIQATGPLSKAHLDLMSRNPALSGLRLSTATRPRFDTKFPVWSELQIDFLQECLEMDPLQRPSCKELLQHDYFTHDQFSQRFVPDMKRKIQQEFSSNAVGRKFGSLVIGKKRKNNKPATNKENQDGHDAKKEKDVREAMKTSPYRQSQARISVTRPAGWQRSDPALIPARGDPASAAARGDPPASPPHQIPPIGGDGPPPPPPPPAAAATTHGWMKEALTSWGISGMAGLASDQLSLLMPRSERSKPLAPVSSCTKSPGVLRRAKETTPGTPCVTCQDVTSRSHVTEKVSPRLVAMERSLTQRRTSEARTKPGVSLPNVPGAVSSKPAPNRGSKPPFSGSMMHVSTLDLLRSPVSKHAHSRPWWH